jgi:hypothetical protein
MAHFAEIDNNIVTRVLVVDNSLEHKGQEFLANECGLGGTWIQTSYNNNFRKQYAGIGYTYDSHADVFIQPQPYPSWSLNADYDWVSPVPFPAEGEHWVWSEIDLNWIPLA